ncbi:MAG: tyrosine-protein phosphatase [Cytophagales bacterium]|nr:tyrosine-protein phosphatase [Cytophagales bacterium]
MIIIRFARILLVMILLIALAGGCKPYERLPIPPYDLKEPAIDSPYFEEWLSSGWKLEGSKADELVNEPNDVISLAQHRPEASMSHLDSATQLVVSHRQIKFEKVLNFRDLGGIRTVDGRQVRWGKIYRSGKLEKLQYDEFEAMKTLNIKTVVDLRTVGEVDHAPDKIPPNQGVDWIHIPISGITDEELERTNKEIRKQTAEEFNGAGKMETVMERFADQGAKDFAKVFNLLLDEDNNSLVYHCTAGKDRTGLLTALILSALGVSEEVIMQEYLLSNYYRHEKMERNARLGAHILGIETAASRAIMDVRPNYLNSSYKLMKSKYGSIQNYLRDGLGLSTQDLDRMKALYLY